MSNALPFTVFGETENSCQSRIENLVVETDLDVFRYRQIVKEADILEGSRYTGLIYLDRESVV